MRENGDESMVILNFIYFAVFYATSLTNGEFCAIMRLFLEALKGWKFFLRHSVKQLSVCCVIYLVLFLLILNFLSLLNFSPSTCLAMIDIHGWKNMLTELQY